MPAAGGQVFSLALEGQRGSCPFLSFRRKKLHIPRFRASAKARPFRSSSSPHEILRFRGAPQEKGEKKEDHIGKTKGFPYDPFLYKGVATPLRPQGRPVRVCVPRGLQPGAAGHIDSALRRKRRQPCRGRCPHRPEDILPDANAGGCGHPPLRSVCVPCPRGVRGGAPPLYFGRSQEETF